MIAYESSTGKSVNKQNGGCSIAFCRRPQLYSVKANWLPVSKHNKRRTRELENWKKKNFTNYATDQAHKVACCCSAALEASGLNWTVKPLVFLISCRRFILLALVFVKFVWRKAVAFRCCGLYIERAVKNKTTNGGYRLVWESVNCWMFVSAIHFFELWRPWRMNTARVLYLWSRFFQPGSIYFCLTFDFTKTIIPLTLTGNESIRPHGLFGSAHLGSTE